MVFNSDPNFVIHKYNECWCSLKVNKNMDMIDGPTTMIYQNNGMWKCPKCDAIHDCSDIIFTMRVEIIEKCEDDFTWKELKIISPYEESLDHVDGKYSFKEVIEDTIQEDEFIKDHELGIFDWHLLYHAYDYMTDCGREYDLDIAVVKETIIKRIEKIKEQREIAMGKERIDFYTQQTI